jgi:hypothetical protein
VTKVALGRLSDPAGRNVVKPEQALYGAFSVNTDFRFCAPVIGAHLQASAERSSRARRRLQTSGGGTTKMVRGELAIGRGSSRHNLVFGRSIGT